jgi:phage/plasmid primase-like uncharacterized protein
MTLHQDAVSCKVETVCFDRFASLLSATGPRAYQGSGTWKQTLPGYDVNGKPWTIQYIKEDGTKRFARDSRKHGCFHVVGAATAPEGLQKLAKVPVVAIAEGYATGATVAKYGNVPAVAAFDSGNLLAVATALHERWPDKRIMIAGDDDHKLENNPGHVKALEAASAVRGMAIFPNLTAEQREKGLTDFNDLVLENPRLAKHQLEEALGHARERSEEVFIGGREGTKIQEINSPNDALERVSERSMEELFDRSAANILSF